MKITDIEAMVVQKPDIDTTAADAMQDAFLVRVKTDEGITGIGEGNHTPQAMKAVVDSPGSHSWSQGIKQLLVGRDPLNPPRMWDTMYRSTVMSGRRGLGVAVLAAIDVALWDLKGKAEGKPVYELLGGATGNPIRPYSSLYFGPGSYETTLEVNLGKIARSRELGFPAYKIEPLSDCVQTNDQIVDMAHRSRDLVDGAMRMLIDVGHRWETSKEALHTLRQVEDCDPGFIETPMWLDDVDGYRRVSTGSSIPVAIGELFVTRNEFVEMMDGGQVDIVQPSVIRVGFTESMRVAEAAAARGRQVVPYGWVATTIGVVANNHFAAALGNCPWTEYCHPELYPQAELRHNLAGPEPVIVDGQFALPPGPGLGVEIDEEALNHYRVA
jgi:L-alanine-DL-glutamate epimerase-like enolase superfamily enzyme